MAQEIPSWLSGFLKTEDTDRIEAAVKAAEKRTSAEIVPMVVHRSTLKATGDRILFWICFGFLGVGGAVGFAVMGGLDEALLDRWIEALGLWPSETTYSAMALAAETVVALFAFAVAWGVAKVLSRFDSIQRIVFPHEDLTLEAEHRAQSEFFSSDLRSTSGRTGVLLFVSMLEHRAVILADEAIIKKFEASAWKETLDRLIEAIRRGEMARGYTEAIDSIATRLETAFPPMAGDRDELSNRLRIEE